MKHFLDVNYKIWFVIMTNVSDGMESTTEN